ncbi:hypothetical protein E5S70_04915 [Ensifer adhaerens]|uniref:GreA/GreB family elongation factor n=1 Tax=Ensifer canadensis TaxID=555315 RepID=UPI00149018D8|nr:GreA/GreB family elongation factor [Ensifer canadensis]NOV15436.1 hypothetical protein [Ensifer canadensis]
MTDWGGFGPPEFGGYPVELEFSLGSFAGPRWVAAAMRHRSGWLAVAEVEMETAFDRTSEIIGAAIDEAGAPVGQWVSEALFSMHCGLPRELDIEPPEELDIALDALYWDFLGRCDLDHLRMLEEKERATSLMAMRLDARRRNDYDATESLILKLYARRRRGSEDPALRVAIDAEVAALEDSQAAMESRHRASLAGLTHELEGFDVEVMESLRNHGHLRKLYAVHWIVRPSLMARADQIFLPQCYSPPVHVLDTRDVRPSYLTRDFVAMSKDPRVRAGSIPAKQPVRIAPRQSVHASQAEVKSQTYRKATKSEKMARDRAAMEQLYLKWKQTDPEKFERERKLREQIAEFNRRRARERELAVVVAAQAAGSHAPPTPPTEANAVVDHDSAAAIEAASSIEVPPRRDIVALGEARARAILDRKIGDLVGINFAGVERAGLMEKIIVPAMPEPVRPAPPAVSDPRPQHVSLGDRVLLRFEDGIRARVQYLILDEDNDPTNGVISTQDTRAQAILGRNVGDRVCLEIAGRERFAVIEKILNFNQGASD